MVSRCLAVIVLLGTASGASAGGPNVSPEEFNLYREWLAGREDVRLEKFNTAAKIKKIAQSLGVSASQLTAAISKVEPLTATLGPDTEKAIREAFAETPLKDKVLSLEVNLDTEHAVAFVKWRCGDPRDHDKEAAYVAWAVSDGGTVIEVLGLWCVNEIDTKLFSAKIARPALSRINRAGVDRFASSRYIKLFEDVKRGPHR